MVCKKILKSVSLFLAFVLLFSSFSVSFALGGSKKQNVSMEKIDVQELVNVNTILVIDNSISMKGTPISTAKEAAVLFCEKVLSKNDNQVGIVVYDTNIVATCALTSDITELEDTINSLDGLGSWTNTTAGINKASTMFTGGTNEIRNIVLLTDGLPTYGEYMTTGQYLSTDYLGEKFGYIGDIFMYANSLYDNATDLWAEHNVISLGFFHNLLSEDEIFCSRLLKDIQNSGYYHVSEFDVLDDIIEDISNSINKNNYLLDSDSDGLPDDWEINGADFDGDGIIDLQLNEMGADPDIPDLYVEVDWMENNRTSFEPSENAMRMVYEAFRDSPNGGINLHIDFGPDSVDFVTGERWRSYPGGSGATSVSYIENIDTDTSDWEDIVNANFSENRRRVFRHSLFINQYDNGTSSGLASGIPGQMFMVAYAGWIDTDLEIAGTFMHELGHTIGLKHGGCDHTHYKPNYLSVMNYLFQTTGLVGVGDANAKLDYSRYVLPDINEYNLNETTGFDPSGITSGTGLGTRWYSSTEKRFLWYTWDEYEECNVSVISQNSIDINNDGDTSDSGFSMDVNNDSYRTTLEGHNDWDNIVFSGGSIGASGSKLPPIKIDPPAVMYDEITKEEAEQVGLLVPVLPEEINLTYKEEYKFDNNDNDSVKWYSDNESVVSVDETTGELSYNGKGTATITAYVDNIPVAQCEVNVTFTWWQWIIYFLLFGFIWY